MAAAVKDINLDPTFADIDRSVRAIMEPPGWKYWVWIGFLATLIAIAIGLWTQPDLQGLQVTGLGDPVMWAVYITNFVFWVGIAHSGTLISAILFLFRTRWRTAVYRAAETMTIFAVATAGLFPVIHLGRPWFFYWLAPYPNQRYLQPDFRSPLTWDFFAISTYLTISTLFWFTGLIPDVANVREVATGWRKQLYTIVALGWQGSDRQWRHFSMAYLLLAGLATPLVLSVHSVVSWDFAMAQLPGWHSTIFAPYFVAGAIFSGVRDGAHAAYPDALDHGSRGSDHALASGQPGQGDFADLARRQLFIRGRVVHGLVQPGPDRADDLSHALFRAVGMDVLGDGRCATA